MVPEPSFVTVRAMVAVPLPLASALAMGGTSLAGERGTVKVDVVWVPCEGASGDDSAHPTARTLRPTRSSDNRFIAVLPFRNSSEEFPSEVEAEIETVREAATRELSERRPLTVVDIELKQVAAGPLLDGEPVGRLVGTVAAGTGSHFCDDVHRGTHSHAAADAHQERVAIDVQDRGRVVNPDWRGVHSEPVAGHS